VSYHIDRERVARIVAEAVSAGDETTCAKYDISQRTLNRWRLQLQDDPKLAQFVLERKAQVERDWVADLPDAISKAIDFLARAAANNSTTDPAMVHSIAGALKILNDVSMGRKMLDARISRSLGPAREAPKPGVPGADDRKVVAIR
jgi:transposase-like protein